MPSDKKITILHVEDDRSLQNLVRVALERLGGFSVRTAADGREALACARELAPALFLLDLDLPGMDGAETLVALREIDGLREVPAIFLTAAGDPEERARLAALGVCEIVDKPFRPRLLLQAVERALLREKKR